MKAKKITTIQIKTTKITLEKMLKDKKISEDEIRIGLNFFKEISAKCREYATEPSCHN